MYLIQEISITEAKNFIAIHHYAKNSPPINKIAIGLFKEKILVGVATWGFGVRPRHTIEKWFVGLTTKNYLELNRLCILDSEPRNTESYFLSKIYTWFRNNKAEIKVLTSWADGLRGKVGYVYQGSSWKYIGKIKSEFYLNQENEVIHPRFLITKYGSRSQEVARNLKLSKIKGYQFFYYKPLIKDKKFKKYEKLPVLDYPKEKDIFFWRNNFDENSWQISTKPTVVGKINTVKEERTNNNLFEDLIKKEIMT